MSANLQETARQILEVVIFENWLRFYFLSEPEGGGLALAVPDQSLARLREQHPQLAPLAEELNGKEISFERSREAVCTFVAARLDDGTTMPVHEVLDSAAFSLEMRLFNTWVQGHEEQLDAAFWDFSTWKRLFAEWRNSDKVKAWAAGTGNAGPEEAPTQ
jgi:hypothetical protein